MESQETKKKVNKLKGSKFNILTFILILISLTVIINTTVAWFAFSNRGDAELNMGQVKLDADLEMVEDLTKVAPNMPIITKAAFTKSDESVDCYVRTKLEYYSTENNLTREQKNYVLVLNTYDYISKIDTGVDGASWVREDDGYFYLLDSEGEFIKVCEGDSYNFLKEGEFIEYPISLGGKYDYPEFEMKLTGLHINLEFQAVQGEYLEEYTYDYIREVFELCFPDDRASDEVFVIFDTMGGSKIEAEISTIGSKLTEPAIPTKENATFEGWYVDKEYTIEFDFENTEIAYNTTIYAKWKGKNFTEGLLFNDGKVVGYIGNELEIVVPSSYSTTGERINVVIECEDEIKFQSEVTKIAMPAQNGCDIFPLVLDDGITTLTYNSVDDMNNSEDDPLTSMTYPCTVSYYYDEFIDGDEYTVTEIGEYGLGNYGLYMAISMAVPCDLSVSKITLPDTITKINDYGFAYQMNLQYVDLNEGLVEIGEGVFEGCYELTSIRLPSTLETINSNLGFVGHFEIVNLSNTLANSDLSIFSTDTTNIVNDINDSNIYTYRFEDDIFYFYYDGTSTELVGMNGKGTISTPDVGVTLTGLYDESKTTILGEYSIGMYKVSYSSLRDVVISGGTRRLELYSFVASTLMERLTIDAPLEYIQSEAFYMCMSLKVLNIKQLVGSVHQAAFADCGNLTYVLCDDYDYAVPFLGVVSQDVVYIKQTSGYDALDFTETDTLGIYTATDLEGKVWIRTGEEDNYTYYKEFESQRSFTQGLLFNEGKVTGYIGDATKVIVPASYSPTGTRETITVTINNLDELISIIFKLASVTNFIDERYYDNNIYPIVFTDANNVVETINNSQEYKSYLATIPNYAYPCVCTYEIDGYVDGGTYQVTEIIDFGMNLSVLYYSMMSNYPLFNLVQEIQLPEGLEKIGACAFAGHAQLTRINIPSTVHTVGEGVFTLCYSLATVILPQNVTTISEEFADINSSVIEIVNLSNIPNDELNVTNGHSSAYVINSISDSRIYTYNDGETTFYFHVNNGEYILIGIVSNQSKIVTPNAGVTLVGFYDNTKKVTLSNYSITNDKCAYLYAKELIFSNSVIKMNDYVIINSAYLQLIKLGEQLTLLGDCAIRNCAKLKVLIVESNSITIGDDVISACDNLSYVLCSNEEVANKFSAQIEESKIYTKQSSGYSSLTFNSTDVNSVYTATDSSGYKWVRIGDSTNGYTYYKSKLATI